MDISLQLYSVREMTRLNFELTLKDVGAMGYDGVEFAGFGNIPPERMKEALGEAGLYSVGSHTGYDLFKNSFEEQLEYNLALGSRYVICPGAKMETLADIEEVARTLNRAAEIAAPHGVKVGYHNHSGEFRVVEGKCILDWLMEKTTENVVMELDIYWAHRGGVDPCDYIEKWGKRVELIHLKQEGENGRNVDMADGFIDMKRIARAAKYAAYFIVEREQYDKPIMECVKNDIQYLKAIL